MKALTNMERIQLSHEMIVKLLSLYESKGKNFYYNDLFKRDQDAFIKNTLENDMVAVAELLDYKLTDARIKWIAKKEFIPKNREEAMLDNVKLSLNQIQRNAHEMEFFANEVDNLIRQLSKNSFQIQFDVYVPDDQVLVKRPKTKSKKDDLSDLFVLFVKQNRGGKFELIHLIANFYVDFVNMKILTSHNDLVSGILLYAMLSKYFDVFKYISFFELFLKAREQWKTALTHANYYWSSNFAQTDLISSLIIEILIEAYRKLEDRAYEYEFERKLNKSNSIENTITKIDEIFTKEDIRLAHPTTSDATIDRTLKELKDQGKIRPLGKGRSSKWQRLTESRKKVYEQLSIFTEE